MKHPRRIGSSWTGELYVHGPRKHLPSRYSEFRLGKPVNGKRVVWGKNKTTGQWERQSTLTPKRRIRLKRKDGHKQHYWKGRKRKNYGSRPHVTFPYVGGRLPRRTAAWERRNKILQDSPVLSWEEVELLDKVNPLIIDDVMQESQKQQKYQKEWRRRPENLKYKKEYMREYRHPEKQQFKNYGFTLSKKEILPSTPEEAESFALTKDILSSVAIRAPSDTLSQRQERARADRVAREERISQRIQDARKVQEDIQRKQTQKAERLLRHEQMLQRRAEKSRYPTDVDKAVLKRMYAKTFREKHKPELRLYKQLKEKQQLYRGKNDEA